MMQKTPFQRFRLLSQHFAFGALLLAVAVSCTGKRAIDNTLRLPIGADAKGFDPILVEDLYSDIAVSQVYEGLLEYNYLKRPHQLQPLLADGMPEVSKDGLSYTFKIKKGVKFMDHAAFAGGKGREVTAQDFIYSFLRVADPKLNSPGFWIFDQHVKGLNEWRDKQKNAVQVDYAHAPEGFKAVDDHTLKITLTQKYPQLLYVLAMAYSDVVAKEVVEKTGADFTNTPVGTGPYKLVSWVRNSKISYDRNPNWRGQNYPSEGMPGDAEYLVDAGKPMPFADKVEYSIFVESQPMWLNFMNGSIDAAGIPKDNFKTVIDPKTQELLPEMSSKGIELRKEPDPDVTYMAFNMEDPVIKKGGANLRKAIALAQDKEKNIEIFSNGRAKLAHSPIPPSIAGYDENFKNPFSSYNVEEAKKYLAKAGYPGGKGLPELVYEANQGSESRQMAEKLQKELAAIGINMKVNVNQFAELTSKINSKKAQMWGIAWIADYPDAENFLQLLYGPNKAPSPNGSNYDSPEYNKLFEKVRSMSDSPERRQLIRRMQDIFVQDLPWVVESHRVNYALRHAWLKNYKIGSMGHNDAKYLRIDMERKKQGLK